MADLRWGGIDFYIAVCPSCDSELAVRTLGDRIEHNDDGSHDFIPDPVRNTDGSGS